MTQHDLRQIQYFHDPLAFSLELLGFRPDAAQRLLLDPRVKKAILCCHRGAGKTELISQRAAHHLYTVPKALVLIASETAEKAA